MSTEALASPGENRIAKPHHRDSGITCRDTSLIRNSAPLGPYSKTMPRALSWSKGGGAFLMSKVPRYESGGEAAILAVPEVLGDKTKALASSSTSLKYNQSP